MFSKLLGLAVWVPCDLVLEDGYLRLFMSINGKYECIGNLNFDLYECRVAPQKDQKK